MQALLEWQRLVNFTFVLTCSALMAAVQLYCVQCVSVWVLQGTCIVHCIYVHCTYNAYSVCDYHSRLLTSFADQFCPLSICIFQAALEALDGLDLFGPEGGHSSVIHILPDDIQQCKVCTI